MTITLRIILGFLAAYFGYCFYQDVVNETVSIRGNVSTLSGDPFTYWFWLIVEAGASVVFSWLTIYPPKPDWENLT